jgi:hypothetical protein
MCSRTIFRKMGEELSQGRILTSRVPRLLPHTILCAVSAVERRILLFTLTITAENGSTWTVNASNGAACTVTITSQTQFGTRRAPGTAQEFPVGSTVHVSGITNGNTVAASRITATRPTNSTRSPPPAAPS